MVRVTITFGATTHQGVVGFAVSFQRLTVVCITPSIITVCTGRFLQAPGKTLELPNPSKTSTSDGLAMCYACWHVNSTSVWETGDRTHLVQCRRRDEIVERLAKDRVVRSESRLCALDAGCCRHFVTGFATCTSNTRRNSFPKYPNITIVGHSSILCKHTSPYFLKAI